MSCAGFSAPSWSGQGAQVEKGLRQTANTCISNRHSCRLETDDPTRIVVPSDQRKPRELSSLHASACISNRHPGRLETPINPCPPITSLFLIVTNIRGLPVSTASRAWGISQGRGIISNRHSCRLETRVNPCPPITSLFLIVTRNGVNLLAFSSSFQNASPRLLRRLDVLIHTKQVRGIVPLLDFGQTVVILAVRRPDAIFALFHHEVDVCAAGRVGMKRAPILFGPRADFFLVRGVRIDPHDHGVAQFLTRLAALLMGYRCIVDCIDGNFAACFRCCAMASSESVRTKSAFQYHCRPGG